MASVENGWFREISDTNWFGQAMSFKIEEILCQQKTKYQDILIFRSASHGNVLVLDDCVQCTDRDEFTYQEMITYLPLNAHPNPKKVLIIGGGDGGVAREVAKHPSVESIVQCEIDEDVVNLCKKFLPNMACGYSHPKHKLHIGCGREFMKQHQAEFDMIITDSSDPIGPAAILFQKEYYELISSALKPDGLLCSQGECPWLDSEFVRNMLEFCGSIFPVVTYAYTNVPTYPCGQIGFVMCSKNKQTNFNQPIATFNQEQLSSFNFKLYNPSVHSAAFALPEFFKKKSKDSYAEDKEKPKHWFWERLRNAPGQSFGLLKEEVLFEDTINNQNVLVFKNFVYGNVFVINDVIQFIAEDQNVLQECLAHLALNVHTDPKKVLIVGGLNGGIIHEVLKHDCVETVVYCEADKELLEVSRKFFPRSSTGFDHAKAQLVIEDYLEFLKKHPNEFDIVITVPTEDFLKPENSGLLRNVLKPNGICISRVPTFWLQLDEIKALVLNDKRLFPTVNLASVFIPTCPYGQTTLVLRGLNPETCFTSPLRQLPPHHLTELVYYNAAVHTASFTLPEFVRKAIDRPEENRTEKR